MEASARWLALCILVVLILAPAPALLAEPLEVEAHRTDLALLPALSFASDTGVGFGGTAAFYVRDPDYRPYQYSARLQLFATTRGIQDHSLTLDAPRLFGSSFRPIVTVGFFRDRFRPYFGVGNETALGLPPGAKKDDFLTYGLTTFYGDFSLEKHLAGPFKANVLYDLRSLSMDVEPGSRLAREMPAGTNGGRSGRLDLELIYDTRDEEASATSGTWASVSAHLAHPLFGSTFTNGGFAAELRSFVSPGKLGAKLVFATRILGDVTWGDVPVAMLTVFGGRSRVEGLGGSISLRGLDRFRYVGQVKVLGNFELRSRFQRLHFAGKPLDLWAVAFLDAGRVWAKVAPDGAPWVLHSARGLGVRAAWVEDFVVRLDVGWGEGMHEIYASVDQLF